MFSWLTHSRLRLRDAPDFCEPKGPNFAWASYQKCKLAGSLLKVRLPRHSPTYSVTEQIQPKLDSVLDFPAKTEKEDIMPDQSWLLSSCLFREWRFCGPAFSGALGAVGLSVTVLQRVNHPEGISYFHPAAFEQGVSDFLTSAFGHEEINGRPSRVGPVNWKPISGQPVLSVGYEVNSNFITPPEYIYMFPIGDRYIACFDFIFDQNCPGFQAERDKRISRDPMWELVNAIVDSIELTLSDEAQTQLDAVRSLYDEYKLSDSFAPLKWPVKSGTKVEVIGEPVHLLSN